MVDQQTDGVKLVAPQTDRIDRQIFLFLSCFRPNFVLFGVRFHTYLFSPKMALLKRQEDCPKDSRGVIDIQFYVSTGRLILPQPFLFSKKIKLIETQKRYKLFFISAFLFPEKYWIKKIKRRLILPHGVANFSVELNQRFEVKFSQ